METVFTFSSYRRREQYCTVSNCIPDSGMGYYTQQACSVGRQCADINKSFTGNGATNQSGFKESGYQ